MFGIDLQTLRRLWTIFLFVLVVFLIYLVGRTIVVFTLAVFLAHLLGPIAERVERTIPDRWLSRNAALALVYLVMIIIIVAALIPVFSNVGQQAAALAQRFPALIDDDPLTVFTLPEFLEPLRDRLAELVRAGLQNADKTIIPLLEDVGANAAGVLGSALAIILIPILSFFFLQDSHDIHDALVDMVPGEHRDLAEDILYDLHVLLVQYIRSLMVLAVIVAVVYFAFLRLTGVSYAILLATVAALMEVIPVVGPLVASVAIVIVALITGFPHLGWLIIFLVVFRLVQDYVIAPHLMSSGVAIHPLLVLFGVLAGEQVAGIAGMFFSVPVIAALRIIVVRLRRRNLTEDVLVEP